MLRLTPHFYWPQLADGSWPVKFDAVGGMQTQIFRLVDALSELDIDQTVLTLRVPPAPRAWEMNERTVVRGVRVPVLPIRSRTRGMMDLNLAWTLGVLNEVVRRRPRADLVHVHCSGVTWPPLLGSVLRSLLGVPIVLTLHCSVLGTYHPMSVVDRFAFHPLARRCEREAVRSAARIVLLTSRLLEGLAEQTGVPSRRFVVVPDSIEAEAFAGLATPERIAGFRERFGLPSGGSIIGYVGRIAHEKGWPLLVETAALLRHEDVHWLVCGDGNEREAFERSVARAGLSHRFTITGYIANELVPAAMSTMDALVLPSLHEEFGGVMLEAMAMRVPVVAYGVGGVPVVLDRGRLGWIVPDRTAPAFANAIRGLLADGMRRERVTEEARKHVAERYRTSSVARRLADVYHQVAGA